MGVEITVRGGAAWRAAGTPSRARKAMDEPSIGQKLAAEVLGTAFLVFIGVGSVPATLIVNGNAPFTMADLGMISFSFALVVIAAVYALGHVSGCRRHAQRDRRGCAGRPCGVALGRVVGCHMNPAVAVGLATAGKFPWRQVPTYIAAQVT